MIGRILVFSGIFLSFPGAQPALDGGAWVLRNSVDAPIMGVAAGGGVILAVGSGEIGVHRSLDSGGTWHPFPPVPAPNRSAHMNPMIRFDPALRRFYCSVDRLILSAAPDDSAWTPVVEAGFPAQLSVDGPTFVVKDSLVKVSRDGGRTWKMLPDSSLFGFSHILAADSCAYLSKPDGPVSTSCDGGATWRALRDDTLSVGAGAMVKYRNTVIAVARGRLIRTLDQGRSWQPWPGGLQGSGEVNQLEGSDDILYAWKYADPQSSSSEIHRSSDGGRTWQRIFTPGTPGGQPFLPSQVAELGPALFGANPYGLIASRDAGDTWVSSPMGTIRRPVLALGIEGARYLAYTDRGVFTTVDSGRTWMHALANDSLSTWTAFGGSGAAFAAGDHRGDIRVTLDAGGQWSAAPALPSPATVLSATAWRGDFYAGTVNGLWRWSASGSAWTEIALPASGGARLLAPGPASLIIGTPTRIWEMRPDGSFEDRSAGIQPALLTHLYPVDDRLFAGNAVAGYLHRWNDSSAAWQTLPAPLPFHSFAATGDLLLISSGKISEDGGRTWRSHASFGTRHGESGFSLLIREDGHFFAADKRGGIWKFSARLPEPPTGILPRDGGLKPLFDGRARLREGLLRLDGRQVRPGRKSG